MRGRVPHRTRQVTIPACRLIRNISAALQREAARYNHRTSGITNCRHTQIA
jgi:hypothetical protein